MNDVSNNSPPLPLGAGKTTLISLLTGLYEPTKGTARVAGYDLTTEVTSLGVDAIYWGCGYYRIVQNCDEGHFDIFELYRPSKFNPSNCLKTIQHLQVYGERQ